ncbi:hypothetical protein LXL04_014423 [Taraxacum kok-saghyz]
MWTSSERFYPNVDKFGTFLPKCGQDGSGYSKPLPLLFPVVVENIAGDAPPPLILRLFLSFRLHEFEREIGGGSRARAGLRPKKKGRLVTHRRFPSQTHAAASSETAAVSKVAARLRRCSHPLPEKEEVAKRMSDDRWEEVRRRDRRQSWASRVKEAAKRGSQSPLKDDALGGKAVTFYITNFPEAWKEDELWKHLRAAGNIVDLFIARKRNRQCRMFGFARFVVVRDIKGCEEKSNNIWLKNLKLWANVSRFSRKEGEEWKVSIPVKPVEPKRKMKSVVVQLAGGGRTYAGAVTGRMEEAQCPEVRNTTSMTCKEHHARNRLQSLDK